MLFALAALVTTGLYLQNPPTSDPAPPLVQLSEDLEAAMPRAPMSAVRKQELEADDAVFRAAIQAKQQGRPVDRSKVVNAVKDLRRTLNNGDFTPGDQKKLAADVDVLRKGKS